MKLSHMLSRLTLGVALSVGTCGAFYSSSARAGDLSHQLGLSFMRGGYVDFGIDASDVVSVVSADYRLGFSDLLQMDTDISWIHAGFDLYSVAVGPILNFAGPINDSFFVGARLGLTGGDGPQGALISAIAGKRFAFNENISYEPSLIYTYHLGNDYVSNHNDLVLNFIAFAITF